MPSTNEKVAALLPMIQPRADGKGWVLSWDTGREYLELELLHDGRVEWFWKDRNTHATEGNEDPEAPFPASFVRRASVFQEVLRTQLEPK